MIPAVAYSGTPTVHPSTPKMGISDPELEAIITETDARTFQVARVYNTGDIDITVTCTWFPNYNVTEEALGLEFTPNPVTLQPDTSTPIYMTVLYAEKVGSYTGTLEFKMEYAAPETPNVPQTRTSGSVKPKIQVVEAILKQSGPAIPPWAIGLAAIWVITLVASGCWLKFHVKKPKLVGTNGKRR